MIIEILQCNNPHQNSVYCFFFIEKWNNDRELLHLFEIKKVIHREIPYEDNSLAHYRNIHVVKAEIANKNGKNNEIESESNELKQEKYHALFQMIASRCRKSNEFLEEKTK